ncbi:copper amine oxidase N-terminal domain-containing protein [Paenibacillus puerhi]|uniref:copper amine oxidase N-terminal domain-containing protein n=1 Tax=Paenibacillus puerhi TaxID=2692622 RepID=UPI001F1DBA11|nr:copper amine oxidase N-terminal domain-containing protein [Paenibacillus puerhi]
MFSGFILALAASLLVSAMAAAAGGKEEAIQVTVDGKKVEFPDAKPFKDEVGRIQVPIRFIGEALGAEVTWEEATETASFRLSGSSSTFTVGKTSYQAGGQLLEMDTTAQRVEGRVYAPARFVAESLGAKVDWDAQSQTVLVTGSGQAVPSDLPPFKPAVSSSLKVTERAASNIEIQAEVDLSAADAAAQKDELGDLLGQRFSASNAEFVLSYVVPDTSKTSTMYLTAQPKDAEIKQVIEVRALDKDKSRFLVLVYQAGLALDDIKKSDSSTSTASTPATGAKQVTGPADGQPLKLAAGYSETAVKAELKAYAVKLINIHGIYQTDQDAAAAEFNKFVDLHLTKDSELADANQVKRSYIHRMVGVEYGWSDQAFVDYGKELKAVSADTELDFTSFPSEDSATFDYRYTTIIEGSDVSVGVQFQFSKVNGEYVLTAIYM